jgi:hypothetical protein
MICLDIPGGTLKFSLSLKKKSITEEKAKPEKNCLRVERSDDTE